MGNKYVPSKTASLSFLKTCSTCVVATCDVIFESILIDLIGKLRGSVIGRGGRGQRSHGPGTITPWAAAVAAIEKRIETDRNSSFAILMIFLGTMRKGLARSLNKGTNAIPVSCF